MSHTVSGELRKAPFIKPGVGQDGQSTLFAVELSEVTKNRNSGENEYTNYNAAIFAKSPAQIDYYNSVLVEGNFIVVTSEKLKINISDCGKYIKLDMDNARLENAGYIQRQQAPQQQSSQGGYQGQQHNNQQQGGYGNNRG